MILLSDATLIGGVGRHSARRIVSALSLYLNGRQQALNIKLIRVSKNAKTLLTDEKLHDHCEARASVKRSSKASSSKEYEMSKRSIMDGDDYARQQQNIIPHDNDNDDV